MCQLALPIQITMSTTITQLYSFIYSKYQADCYSYNIQIIRQVHRVPYYYTHVNRHVVNVGVGDIKSFLSMHVWCTQMKGEE